MRNKAPKLNKQLRKDSGLVDIDSRLVSFLYTLLIDHVPAGVIQRVLEESIDPVVKYSNGYVAKYAEYVAKVLLSNNVPRKEMGIIAKTKRSKNYDKLSPREQWEEDKRLGILDWDGKS